MIEKAKNTLVHYEDDTLKVFIRHESMFPDSNFHTMQHMHEEMEIMEILDGCIYYNINGKEVKVEKGDCIFINANCMHVSYLNDSTHCTFNVLLIHPSLFQNNMTIYESYVKPVISSDSSDYLLFHQNTQLTTSIHHMLETFIDHTSAYQLSLIGESYNVLRYVYEEMMQSAYTLSNQKDMAVLHTLTNYIYTNYANKITLQDIASSTNISLSKCTRLFNAYMHHSPIDFLNLYRLEIASNLLRTTKLSISDIATQCGFEQQSYFNRIFRKEYGCTPLQYRKNPVDKFVH